MRMLIIEDEADHVQRVRDAIKASGQNVELVTSTETGLEQPFETGAALEEQMLARVQKLQTASPVDLVMLDSDLSRVKTGISQTLCRQTFQDVGIPVCRYKKRHAETELSRFQDLRRIAREGASAVWVPPNYNRNQELAGKLIPWLVAVEAGFKLLRAKIDADPALLTQSQGPAGILAEAIGQPEAKSDFLGYTAQNFFFFGTPAGEDETDPSSRSNVTLATQLGYWLFNYILEFPGPILSETAAAAYLNLQQDSFADADVQALVKQAVYDGPFSGTGRYYWRNRLAEILDGLDADIATAATLKGKDLKRVDPETPERSAYLCVVTQKPIAVTEAAPNPDWIPAGAQVARISQASEDKLGPMLST